MTTSKLMRNLKTPWGALTLIGLVGIVIVLTLRFTTNLLDPVKNSKGEDEVNPAFFWSMFVFGLMLLAGYSGFVVMQW